MNDLIRFSSEEAPDEGSPVWFQLKKKSNQNILDLAGSTFFCDRRVLGFGKWSPRGNRRKWRERAKPFSKRKARFYLLWDDMEAVVQKYDSFKIDECIELLNEERKVEDGLLENFIRQNCMNVCKCLDAFTRNDFSKINEALVTLSKTYQNIVAVDLPGKSLPIQLELTAFFNYLWWNFYYALNENVDVKVYLPVIQKGLRRVLGISCKVSNYVSLVEDILCDIKGIEKKMQTLDYWTLSLLLEVIGLTFLYILKIDKSNNFMEQCLLSLKSVIEGCNALIPGLAAVKDFKNPSLFYNHLFKFGISKMNGKVSDPDTCAIGCLNIIKSVCLFYLKSYKALLVDMKENIKYSIKPLWYYLGGLSSLMLNEFNQCQGFLILSASLNLGSGLKSRFSILHGLLMSKKGKYKESINFFGQALEIYPSNRAALYYMGEEYGKTGLNDEMIKCFQTLVKVKEGENQLKSNCPFDSNFESVILDLLHPGDEISELEVVYAAAIALGIDERFQEAAKMFEKYLDIYSSEKECESKDDRVVKTPDLVTVLHEAVTVNILIGNLDRARSLLEKSSAQYTVKEHTDPIENRAFHPSKDINWIRNVLDRELGQKSMEKERETSECLFTEEMVNFFEVDVIALMLLAEIESKLGSDTYKIVLGKVISTFSKYIAQMLKEKNIDEEGKAKLSLVKALSSKIWLKVAKYQVKERISVLDTERTFKKALTCNPGDKDVLYEYCKFLMAEGNTFNAQKLWKTFCLKESIASVDQCQSLALRLLLQTHVSKGDLKKLGSDLELSLSVKDFRLKH